MLFYKILNQRANTFVTQNLGVSFFQVPQYTEKFASTNFSVHVIQIKLFFFFFALTGNGRMQPDLGMLGPTKPCVHI